MDPIALLRAALAGGPLQHDRLLRLHTPLGPGVLVAETLDGVESVDGGGFRFELTALSVDAHLSLDALLGQPVLLQWQTDGNSVMDRAQGADAIQSQPGSARTLSPLHGHVTRVERVGSNGGLARYALRIEPWLAFLRQRVDCYVFQDMTVVDIVESVFADYVDGVAGPGGGGRLVPAWRWALNDASVYRKRCLTTQYEESDFAFVERLLAEEGIAYWFEHAGTAGAALDGSGGANDASWGTHTLVLGDHADAFAALGSVRHHISAATERRDGVHTWVSARRWRPVQLRRASWDYKTLDVRAVEAGAGGDASGVLDDDTAGPYAWPDRDTGERLARQQWEALQVGAQAGQGAGTWRRLRAGARFRLLDSGGVGDWRSPIESHSPSLDGDGGNALTCLRVRHRARNNLGARVLAAIEQALGSIATTAPELPGAWTTPADAACPPRHPGFTPGPAGLEELRAADAEANPAGAYFYRNDFDAIPAHLPYRPVTVDGHGVRRHPRPTVYGTQNAVVVGDGAPLLTDRDHRIKVQFPWQRGGDAANRLDHPSGDANAPADGGAWTWVRVAVPWAGDNWGSVLVPRQGQEVLVAFLEGDIDRPVVIGSVYNGRGNADAAHNRIAHGAGGATGNAPAWFDGNGHPAVFTGLKSQQLADSQGGSGGYQQLRLDDTPGQGGVQASTTQYASGLTLGHLKAGCDNLRGDDRGFGAELTTQASGALRAGAGLLLTTEQGSQQLTAASAQAQLQQGAQLLQSLQDAARTQTATLPGEGATLPVQHMLAQLQQTLQASQQGTAPGDGIGGGEGEAPGWSAPALVASSHDGIVALTAADHVWSSGAVTALTAGNDLQWMSQGEAVAAVAGGVLLYAHGNVAPKGKPNQERGIALHAAQGAVSVRAHSDLARVAALKQVALASTQADIQFAANKHVLATAAGAYLRIEGDHIELGAPGGVVFKGTEKKWTGARAFQVNLPALPKPALNLPDEEQRFSQRFDFSEMVESGSHTGLKLDSVPITVTTTSGEYLATLLTDVEGVSSRVFTADSTEIVAWVGDGEWEVEEEFELIEGVGQESGSENG